MAESGRWPEAEPGAPWDEAQDASARRGPAVRSEDEPPRFSLRMPDLSDILPELPLAPAPADEPAAPLWESDEWAREEQARRDARRTTRHDAEHGSVAARSVLDRLGISAGDGVGGRRRADAAGQREDEAGRQVDAPGWEAGDGVEEPGRRADAAEWRTGGEPARRVDASGWHVEEARQQNGEAGRRADEPERWAGEAGQWAHEAGRRAAAFGPQADEAEWPAEAATQRAAGPAEPGETGAGEAKTAAGSAREPELDELAGEPWLPRLRMPPALDPLTDVEDWTPSSQPFPDSYARAIAEDEPAADAGLAELLARALAEHQAGTASAAALVKRLGPEDGTKRSINGHATADRHRRTD
ncbi:hypothetical protein ATK36_5436 [Amycolatopsis sulphurea]|uniref:Uncharacterized protein n=1 Tax=Amycolatopsis sulphurea TaxID=76022 RepID=A0A2A9FH27_9PSEU|nr:hypothetical protein ATK36_5436 [Amycolatopsis sulphurea]